MGEPWGVERTHCIRCGEPLLVTETDYCEGCGGGEAGEE